MFRFVTCKKLNSVQQFFFSQQDLDQWIIKIRLFRNHIVPYCSVQDPGQHTDYPNPLLHTLFPCCDRWAVQAWTSRGAAVTPCPPAAAAAAHGASPHTTPHLTTGRRRHGMGGGGVSRLGLNSAQFAVPVPGTEFLRQFFLANGFYYVEILLLFITFEKEKQFISSLG